MTGFREDIFGYVPDNSPHFRLTGPFKDLVPGSFIARFAFLGIVALYLLIKDKNIRTQRLKEIFSLKKTKLSINPNGIDN